MQPLKGSPLRPMIRPLGILFVLSLAFAIGVKQVHALRPVAPGSYFPAIFSGLGLVTAFLWARLTDAKLAGVLGGRPLAHWTIDGERWQAFAARQRAHAKRKRLLLLLFSPVLLSVCAFISTDTEASFGAWLGLSMMGMFGLGTYHATRPGQGAFAATTRQGQVVLTDAYAVVAGVLYREIPFPADADEDVRTIAKTLAV